MRPTREGTLLGVAELIAQRSTCNRLAVGVVIARQGRILTTGYNGPPSGMDHCAHPVQDYKNPDSIPCSDAVHAEANAVSFAARYGMSTEGAEAFLTHSPCLPCAKLLINAGIIRVMWNASFRDMSGAALLQRAGVELS